MSRADATFSSANVVILRYHQRDMSPQPWIEVVCNDRVGRKVRVKCLPQDSIGDFKSVLAVQLGGSADRIVLKKGYITFKDHITLADYEIHDQSMVELYYS